MPRLKQPISVKIVERDELRKYAEDNDTTISRLVQKWVAELLENEKNKPAKKKSRK